MNVKLVSYTPDAARMLILAKSTRLEMTPALLDSIAAMPDEQVNAELAEIAATIPSAWEFVDYTFLITGVTRAFTHQFVRTRTGSYAQQTHRGVGMASFMHRLPDTVKRDTRLVDKWNHCMDQIADTYEYLVDSGIPRQDARGVLPTNVLTNILAKFNLRTLADMVRKRINLRVQGEYVEVVSDMAAEAMEVHPWLQPFLWPERTQTPVLDSILEEMRGAGAAVDNPRVAAAAKELDKVKANWG